MPTRATKNVNETENKYQQENDKQNNTKQKK